jgi:hypothetical protein
MSGSSSAAPRPLLVTAAGLLGIMAGAVAVLRILLLAGIWVLAPLEFGGRDAGLFLLLPAAGVVLAGGIAVLCGRPTTLLRWGAPVLLAVDVLNGITYVAVERGNPVNDVLGAIVTSALLVVLLQRSVRGYRTGW